MDRTLPTLATFWLLLCCVAVSRQLSITEFEVPSVVPVGADVELKCSYELSDNKNESEANFIIKWWKTPLPQDAAPDWRPLDSIENRKELYHRIGGQPSSNQQVVMQGGDTILLRNMAASDSGAYECEVQLDNGQELREHQIMVVFSKGTGPELNVSKVASGSDEDQQDVSIECAAGEVGPLPLLVVTVNGIEVNVTLTVSGPDASGLYDAVANVTTSASQADGADIRCELLYLNPNVTHPQYLDRKLYYLSGAGSSEPPAQTSADTAPDTLQQPTGDASQARGSWAVLGAAAMAFSITALV